MPTYQASYAHWCNSGMTIIEVTKNTFWLDLRSTPFLSSVSLSLLTNPVLSRWTLFPWCPPSALPLTLFGPPLPQSSLNPGGGWGRRDLMRDHPKVSHSLHIVWLWVSVFHPLQKEASLMIAEQGL